MRKLIYKPLAHMRRRVTIVCYVGGGVRFDFPNINESAKKPTDRLGAAIA